MWRLYSLNCDFSYLTILYSQTNYTNCSYHLFNNVTLIRNCNHKFVNKAKFYYLTEFQINRWHKVYFYFIQISFVILFSAISPYFCTFLMYKLGLHNYYQCAVNEKLSWFIELIRWKFQHECTLCQKYKLIFAKYQISRLVTFKASVNLSFKIPIILL